MNMTAKHFEKLATVIRDQVLATQVAYPVSWNLSDEYLLLEEIASDLSDVCEGENTLFDRERFLTACGVDPNI